MGKCETTHDCRILRAARWWLFKRNLVGKRGEVEVERCGFLPRVRCCSCLWSFGDTERITDLQKESKTRENGRQEGTNQATFLSKHVQCQRSKTSHSASERKHCS